MKKNLLMFLLTAVFLCIQGVQAYEFEGIFADYQAVYTPSSGTWSMGAMADGRIVLTKKTSSGSGSYSEYYDGKGKLVMALSSNYEFIRDGRLIGVNNSALKFNEIVYKNGKFIEKPLGEKEVAEIFPNVEIVNNDGEIKIKKGWFKQKDVLIFNDTSRDFYKYSYKPSGVCLGNIKGLITLKTIGVVKFSHYSDKQNSLKLYVHN